MRRLLVAGGIIIAVAGALPAAAASPTPESDGLELTYVANEGVLLRQAGRTVLIDTLFDLDWSTDGPPSAYEHLRGDQLRRLREARAPFDSVDVVLVTHAHADHHEIQTARTFLEHSRGTHLVGPSSVVGPLMGRGFHLHEVQPAHGDTALVPGLPVAVTALGLRHRMDPAGDLPHNAYLLEMGGLRIVHLGDSYADLGNYDGFDQWRETGIDLLLLPWWYVVDEEGRRIAEEVFAPRTIVVLHANRFDRAKVRKAVTTLEGVWSRLVMPETLLSPIPWTHDPPEP